MSRVDGLFAIDAQARTQGLDLEQRQALRGQRALALLAELRCQIEQARGEALPASALGRAAAYALAQWPKLVRFLDYPELELSNNLAENAIRPVALGRKNWAPGQRRGGTEDRGYPFGGGDLPTVGH